MIIKIPESKRRNRQFGMQGYGSARKAGLLKSLRGFLAFLLSLYAISSVYASEPKYLTASWYSIKSLKKEGTYKYSKGVMANGKLFDENKKTCATRDFELGTILKITNLQNKKSVIVRITDRTNKRFKGKRIDLSKRAFGEIADLKQGVIPVKVERIK